MFYTALPVRSFWKKAIRRDNFIVNEIYSPKFEIVPDTAISTAGSCFAQRIGQQIRQSNAKFLDLEPAPRGMLPQTALKYGCDLYSARYGNIYTTAQLLQLVEDSISLTVRDGALWELNGRWYDGIRPTTEPNGYDSRDMLVEARTFHLSKVFEMFSRSSVFIFTLGLSERWQSKTDGTVYPIYPAAFNAAFKSADHEFRNANVLEIVDDLTKIISLLRVINDEMKILLTVSPIPLVATATGEHVLNATIAAKSKLRAAADFIVSEYDYCDYFPSYELATSNPLNRNTYQANGRDLRSETVDEIMNVFFAGHPQLVRNQEIIEEPPVNTVCEEVLLEAAGA